ncbi:MAG: YcxB family protein [Blastocatellia bacterium]|nr:YcxB family protein [Blastocatellia bacterium]
MILSIDFYLNWDEYFEAQEFFRRYRYSVAPEKVIGWVLTTLSALWFFLDELNIFAIIGSVAGLLIVLTSPHLRRWVSKRKWNREPLYQTKHRVSFNEDGIYFLMGRIESNLDWKYYQRMLETPDGFLLVYGNDSFNLFPKRAFAGEDMISSFRSLATARLLQKSMHTYDDR